MVEADAYVFDIDGTLLVTRDLVHWNGLHQAMLEAYGVDTTIAGLSYHGKTDIGILRMALNRCGIAGPRFEEKLPVALAAICREVSDNCSGMRPEVCPGIRELLNYLRDHHKLLGIASGNLEIVGWHKIAAAGLRDFFLFGSFGDSCELRSAIYERAAKEVRTRLGNNARICFIGDTPEDIIAARHANASVIAVATGVYKFDELAALRPDACYHSCTELVRELP